ncbi:MAG: chromosome partitioning protein [Actinomycetes bacterium]
MTLRVATALADAVVESAVVNAIGRSSTDVSVVRRCRDVVELRAVALTSTVDIVVIDGHMRGLDREMVAELGAAQVRCIALTDSDVDVNRLSEIGVTVMMRGDLSGLVDALWGAPLLDDPLIARTSSAVLPSPEGRLVAVWGPTGAPGRTSVAVELAAWLRADSDTLLVDADTIGPSVAQNVGLIDDTSGFAAAVRLAARGSLDPDGLAGSAVMLPSGLRVLVGLPSADRWTELRPASVEAMVRCARSTVAWTVVDVGFGIEGSDLHWVDPGNPVRYGAARSVLAAADLVVCVGRPDPVGVVRLIKGIREVRDLAPTAALVPVLNRVVSRAEGRAAAGIVTAELVVPEVLVLPDDPQALGSAMAHGTTVAERSPGSPFVRGIGELGHRVVSILGSYDEPHGRAEGTYRRLLRRPHRRHRHRDARVV